MTAFSAEDYVYLDWAATAPLCEEAARAMAPFLVPGRVNVALGANANSLHSPGRAAFAALEDARRSLARDLHAARASEIVLTSGATEADNAAVLGLARAAVDARRQAGRAAAVPHVVTTAVEHEAVLEPVRVLERAGYRVTRLAPDARGFVQAGALADAVDGDTVLVSVQMANSEVGSIQPVADLAQIAHEAGALFHTDATQALGKMPVDLAALGVDAASFSAHKVGGPKGVGALYLRARTPFSAQLLGGGQEDARRSGTQNVCGAAGFAAACHAACASGEEESARQRALRDRLYAAAFAPSRRGGHGGRSPGKRRVFAQHRARAGGGPGKPDARPALRRLGVRGFGRVGLFVARFGAEPCAAGARRAGRPGARRPARLDGPPDDRAGRRGLRRGHGHGLELEMKRAAHRGRAGA